MTEKNDDEGTAQGIRFEDVEKALRAFDPNAPKLLQQLLDEDDPALKDAPTGTIRTNDLVSQLSVARRKRQKKQRIKASTDVWKKFLLQKAPLPPRFKVSDVVTDLYLNAGVDGRAMALRCLDEVEWKIGFFGAVKRIGKIAEERHDAVAWASVYGRIQRQSSSPSGATRSYMAKRAWRFLRDLGRAAPELYPWWGAEYLLRDEGWSPAGRKITASFTAKSWGIPPALHDAWKTKPDPLFLIVQGASQSNTVKSAWEAMKKLHAEAAKEPSAAWVKTLISDENDARHEIFVEIAKKSPTFALAQLPGLGLFQPVLRLLLSSSKAARAFAIELARAHAKDISAAQLVDFARRSGQKEVKELAKDLLTTQKPRDLGPALLVSMLAVDTLQAFAEKSLLEAFSVAELGESLVVDLAYDDDHGGHDLFLKLDKKHTLAAALWKRVLEDERLEDDYNLPDEAIGAFKKISATASGADEIGAEWLLDILVKKKDKLASEIEGWLEKQKTPFPSLSTQTSVDRVKGLLFDRDLQSAALAILANKTLVNPKQLGIPWLLALAKRKDNTLQQFANRTLLESMGPGDFSPDGNAQNGEARLFEMALSPTESELLRKFAQTFLRCHHKEIGEQQAESKLIGLKPQLKREAYSLERMWPGLKDSRDDVRRFAVTIAKVELRRWNAMGRLGEIADTDAVDVRRLALDAMLKAGDPASDPACTATVDELVPEVVFPLTESRRRPVREAGMELIRRHYKKLGGQERLAWLMTTADREVRLFAVRLLWEKHRPRSFPTTWQPKSAYKGAPILDLGDRFADDEALRWFLRRVMFALPPGRSMEAKEDNSYKRISSSVAKKRVVQIVRDLAVEDEAFAVLVRPILTEMSASIADGEWQACLQALCAIDAVHGRQGPAAATSSQPQAAE